VQIGLQSGTLTARWVRSFSAGSDVPPALPNATGNVRRVTSTNVELDDGTAVPYHSKPIVSHCWERPSGVALRPTTALGPLVHQLVKVGVDPVSGELKTVECIYLV
jgi:hypothetical protein